MEDQQTESENYLKTNSSKINILIQHKKNNLKNNNKEQIIASIESKHTFY
jgi:hypothetical protein